MENKKAFHIEFGSIDSLGKQAMQALDGKRNERNQGRSAMFTDLADFMSFMFPAKFMLLMLIKAKAPTSMYELAKLVKRSQSGVLKDCKELELMGFIDLKKTGPRNAMQPMLSWDFDSLLVHSDIGEVQYSLPKAKVAA